MSRWDTLKCENRQEKEHRSKGVGFYRNQRWVPSTSSSSRDVSREENYDSISSRLGHHRQRTVDGKSTPSSTETKTLNDVTLPLLTSEYEALANSLKLLLFRYQSMDNNKDGNESVVIANLMKLLCDATNICKTSKGNEQLHNTVMFMALLNVLDFTKDNEVFNGDDNIRVLVAKTIESCFKLHLNGTDNCTSQKLSLSKSEVEFGITTLSYHYKDSSVQQPNRQSLLNSSLLVAIALLVRNNVSKLPPESTARNIVGRIFIPYFSSLKRNEGQDPAYPSRSTTESNLTITYSSSVFKMKCVFEATIALLEQPSHASAILSPLVQDVSIEADYGIEEQIINPLRLEFLRVLLECLQTSYHQENNVHRRIDEDSYVCRTLSASINAIRKLKIGNETYNATHNVVDGHIIKTLQKFILYVVIENNKIMRKTPHRGRSLEDFMVILMELLRALICCYPNGVIDLGWKLIIEDATRYLNSRYSNFALPHTTNSVDGRLNEASSYLPLMLILKNENDEIVMQKRCQALIMDCIVDFILVLPWNKWLEQSGLTFDNQHAYSYLKKPCKTRVKRATSGMYKTIVDALILLIQISNELFCKWNDDRLLMKSLGRLIKSLMLEIPYCDIKLTRAGCYLWDTITKAVLNHEKSTNSSLNKGKTTLACEILVACSGGTVTPQGQLRGMSVAAQTWFLGKNPSSEMFLKYLLDSFESMDDQFDHVVKIFSSVLRTLPDVALRRWDAFLQIFIKLNATCSKNNNISIKDSKLIEILESFMLGRKDFGVSTDLEDKNDRIITDLDGIMRKQWDQNNLKRCITIYSAFRSQDWTELDRLDGCICFHFEKILSHCQNYDSKIREAAARAIGEFCTQFIFGNDLSAKSIEKIHQYRFFTHRVHETMVKLSSDNHAGVRSMSIFSFGNLASSLKGTKPKEILGPSRLHVMSTTILRSFKDSNDKVVKNAIRSVGHTSNLMASFMRLEGFNEHFSTSCKLLVETIESLAEKLWTALHMGLNMGKKTTMTWKERSAAKKHGWGACHSLGLVFEELLTQKFEKCDGLISACTNAVRYLILCSRHFAVLNEKVVIAAMAAMCQIPRNFFTVENAQKIVLGDALKTAILILQSAQNYRTDNGCSAASINRVRSAKLTAQNEKYLLHVLNSASSIDAIHALADDQITTQNLSVLYSWMVKRSQLDNLSSVAFEIFAIALQHPGRWSTSVELEQQFTSRALQKCKQEQNDSNSPAREMEDEADEL